MNGLLAYIRGSETLRSFVGLPPTGQYLGVDPVIYPTFDALAFADLSEQEWRTAGMANAAPGGNGDGSVTVPAGQIWLLDAVAVEGRGPATSGRFWSSIKVNFNRANATAGVFLMNPTLNAPVIGTTQQLGVRVFPPLVCHPGDIIVGRNLNEDASVGNVTLGILSALVRVLRARS